MDRRKFLTKTPLAGAGLVSIATGTDTRLYGQPASSACVSDAETVVPHLLRLHYSIEGLQAGRANAYPALSGLAKAILRDQSVAAQFAADPAGYLQQLGFATNTFDVNSIEFRMAQALADPNIREAARKRDHIAFANAMTALLYPSNGSSELMPNAIVLGGEPCCATSFASVNVVVNIDVLATAAVVALSVVVALISVIAVATIFVPGYSPVESDSSCDAAVANALAGPDFSHDVVRRATRHKIDELLAGINSGAVNLPDGISAQAAIDSINSAIERHLF